MCRCNRRGYLLQLWKAGPALNLPDSSTVLDTAASALPADKRLLLRQTEAVNHGMLQMTSTAIQLPPMTTCYRRTSHCLSVLPQHVVSSRNYWTVGLCIYGLSCPVPTALHLNFTVWEWRAGSFHDSSIASQMFVGECTRT